jgi:hypothetical protein
VRAEKPCAAGDEDALAAVVGRGHQRIL